VHCKRNNSTCQAITQVRIDHASIWQNLQAHSRSYAAILPLGQAEKGGQTSSSVARPFPGRPSCPGRVGIVFEFAPVYLRQTLLGLVCHDQAWIPCPQSQRAMRHGAASREWARCCPAGSAASFMRRAGFKTWLGPACAACTSLRQNIPLVEALVKKHIAGRLHSSQKSRRAFSFIAWA
jgi:hypothetical protein